MKRNRGGGPWRKGRKEMIRRNSEEKDEEG